MQFNVGGDSECSFIIFSGLMGMHVHMGAQEKQLRYLCQITRDRRSPGGGNGNPLPYMTTGKTIALTRWTFVVKVMSLLFNMLSRFVIAFLPRSKRLLISSLQYLLISGFLQRALRIGLL